ncbi:MAG: hypothetical protein QXW97_01520 [Candidatus Pacearchaeota archaeon]
MIKDLDRHKSRIGSWAFLGGVIVALLIGLLSSYLTDSVSSTLTVALVIIGLIVGFLNITERETTPFLMSGIVLILAIYAAGNSMDVIPPLVNVLKSLMLIFVPATIIVAIKNVWTLAKN